MAIDLAQFKAGDGSKEGRKNVTLYAKFPLNSVEAKTIMHIRQTYRIVDTVIFEAVKQLLLPKCPPMK